MKTVTGNVTKATRGTNTRSFVSRSPTTSRRLLGNKCAHIVPQTSSASTSRASVTRRLKEEGPLKHQACYKCSHKTPQELLNSKYCLHCATSVCGCSKAMVEYPEKNIANSGDCHDGGEALDRRLRQ